MARKLCGRIEVSGLADILPIRSLYFNRLSIQETIPIPYDQPDAGQIIFADADLQITNTKIPAPKGLSEHGRTLAENELTVEGEILQTVAYIADNPARSAHTFSFAMPFGALIAPPEKILPERTAEATGYIEDIIVESMDTRTIYMRITVLLDAKFE